MLTIFSWLIVTLSVTTFGLYCSTIVFGVTDRSNTFYDMCNYYYRFNKRYGVIDPPTWLQIQRFDLNRCRDQTPRRNTASKPELNAYQMQPAPLTGVFSDWNTDILSLQKICEWLIQLAQFYLTDRSKDVRPKILAVMRDFAQRYAKALEGKIKDFQFPWGNNWYQFSISSTIMLFYFILITNDDTDKVFAADLILRLIANPKKSLGWNRDQANSVYMALPWIVAHYVKGDVYQAAQDPAYVYAVNYMKMPVVDKRKEEGLYLDKTYVTHAYARGAVVLAYGYLSEMTTMAQPIIGFDNLMRNFVLNWRMCQRILGHKTIPYGGIGFHARDRRLKQFTVKDGTYGIECMPTCLFLRMYGEKYAFSMRGQVPWIAYYEADRSNHDMAQYWVQCRQVFFAGKEYEATFPVPGFCHQTYTDKSKKTRVDSRCSIRTIEKTTSSFANGPGLHKQALRFGFVFAYKKVGILRHFYNAREMIYADKATADAQYAVYDETVRKNSVPDYTKLPDQYLDDKKHPMYGRSHIDEFVLCDYENHTVDIWIKIIRKPISHFTVHASKPIEFTEPTGNILVHLHWDCKTETLTDSWSTSHSERDDIRLQYPKGIDVVNTDDTVMLLEDGKPRMAMYPDERLDLVSNFTTKWQGKEYHFDFDALTNQFWLAGICIDKT